MAGKKGRSGPRIGNVNALKTGAKISKHRLVIGDLPVELISVRREARAYRRALEAAVMAAKDEIGMTACHLIDTAAAATVAAGIGRWLLKHRLATMSVGEIMNCQNSIVKAKAQRDKAVEALNIDAPPPDPWAIIDARATLTLADESEVRDEPA